MKHTVAVTGGTGKVGVHIVQRLLRAGYQVHVLVRSRPPAEHPLLCENITLVIMDLATLPVQRIQDWLSIVRPQALIHTAALADVPSCEQRPDLAYLMNTYTTKILATACADHHIHFILLSTEYVFDGALPTGFLYHEDDPVKPTNYYGKSKVQAEMATQVACTYKTLWTICRTSMVYGTIQKHRPDFVQWVRTTLQQHKSIQVAADQINSPTSVSDLAQILVTVIELRLQGVYHVSGSTPISRYHFALKVAQHYALDETLIQPVLTSDPTSGLRRPLNAGLCVDKISKDAAISPMSLEEGLEGGSSNGSIKSRSVVYI